MNPVIPQTREQARARDRSANLHGPLTQTPEAELAVLRNAIRQHRDAIPTSRKHDADQALWAHVEDA